MNFKKLDGFYNTRDLHDKDFYSIFGKTLDQYSEILSYYGKKGIPSNKTYAERFRNCFIGCYSEFIVARQLGAQWHLGRYTDLELEGKILEVKCHAKMGRDYLGGYYGIRNMERRLRQPMLEKEKRNNTYTFDYCLCFYHENSKDDSNMIPATHFTIADHGHILRESLQICFLGVFDRSGKIIYNARTGDN